MNTPHKTALESASCLGLLQSRMPADRWLDDTSFLNLDDKKIRLRAQTLTQSAQSVRARALSIFAYVQSLEYRSPGFKDAVTARQVLDQRHGHAYGKSTLFVALLRAADIPARMRFLQLRGKVLRGLAPAVPAAEHAVVEAWIDDAWRRTDVHVYDHSYLMGAFARLREAKLRSGLGIHSMGQATWTAKRDAFIGFAPDQESGVPLADWGVYNDPQEYRREQLRANFAYDALQGVRRMVYAPMINRTIVQTRELGRHLRAQRRAQRDTLARQSTATV